MNPIRNIGYVGAKRKRKRKRSVGIIRSGTAKIKIKHDDVTTYFILYHEWYWIGSLDLEVGEEEDR